MAFTQGAVIVLVPNETGIGPTRVSYSGDYNNNQGSGDIVVAIDNDEFLLTSGNNWTGLIDAIQAYLQSLLPTGTVTNDQITVT
jgi:hypothetical protein